MAAPTGYDVGFTQSTVNSGAAAGFLLDENEGYPLGQEAFVESQAIVSNVDVTTGGAVTIANYGLGATTYTLRVMLRTDVLKRDRRPTTETPDTLRTLLKAYAAITDGTVRMDTATLSRRVAFVDAIKFVSGLAVDGYVAILTLADVGA